MITKTTILLAVTAGLSQAATITANPGGFAGELSNFQQATLGVGDVTSFSGDFSTWAWHDTALGEEVGWRHTADWFELTLSDDALVTFTLGRMSGGPNDANKESLFPSFTLYQGFNDITDANDSHIFNNIADTTINSNGALLTYLTHVDNTTEESITATFDLAAGNYTFAMGGNNVSEPGTTALPADYVASLSASAVPEPTSVGLLALAAVGLLRRRRC